MRHFSSNAHYPSSSAVYLRLKIKKRWALCSDEETEAQKRQAPYEGLYGTTKGPSVDARL